MSKASGNVHWQSALVTLTSTVVAVVVVVTLYWAQSVFIPLALAVFLTFLLSPFVTWFRQHGPGSHSVGPAWSSFSRALSLGTAGWLATDQITKLIRELPKHSEEVKNKFNSARNAVEGLNPLKKMIDDLDHEPQTASRHQEAGRRRRDGSGIIAQAG